MPVSEGGPRPAAQESLMARNLVRETAGVPTWAMSAASKYLRRKAEADKLAAEKMKMRDQRSAWQEKQKMVGALREVVIRQSRLEDQRTSWQDGVRARSTAEGGGGLCWESASCTEGWDDRFENSCFQTRGVGAKSLEERFRIPRTVEGSKGGLQESVINAGEMGRPLREVCRVPRTEGEGERIGTGEWLLQEDSNVLRKDEGRVILIAHGEFRARVSHGSMDFQESRTSRGHEVMVQDRDCNFYQDSALLDSFLMTLTAEKGGHVQAVNQCSRAASLADTQNAGVSVTDSDAAHLLRPSLTGSCAGGTHEGSPHRENLLQCNSVVIPRIGKECAITFSCRSRETLFADAAPHGFHESSRDRNARSCTPSSWPPVTLHANQGQKSLPHAREPSLTPHYGSQFCSESPSVGPITPERTPRPCTELNTERCLTPQCTPRSLEAPHSQELLSPCWLLRMHISGSNQTHESQPSYLMQRKGPPQKDSASWMDDDSRRRMSNSVRHESQQSYLVQHKGPLHKDGVSWMDDEGRGRMPSSVKHAETFVGQWPSEQQCLHDREFEGGHEGQWRRECLGGSKECMHEAMHIKLAPRDMEREDTWANVPGRGRDKSHLIVSELLVDCGLRELVSIFQEESIDCEALSLLADLELHALGVRRVGDRVKLRGRAAAAIARERCVKKFQNSSGGSISTYI